MKESLPHPGAFAVIRDVDRDLSDGDIAQRFGSPDQSMAKIRHIG